MLKFYIIGNLVKKFLTRCSISLYKKSVLYALTKSKILNSNINNIYIDELKHTCVFESKQLLSIRHWKDEYRLKTDTVIVNILRNLEYLLKDRFKVDVRLSRDYLTNHKKYYIKEDDNNIRELLKVVTKFGMVEEVKYDKYRMKEIEVCYSAEYYISVIGSLETQSLDLNVLYKKVFISKIKELISQHTPVLIGVKIYPEIMITTRSKLNKQNYTGSLNTNNDPMGLVSANIVGYTDEYFVINLGWGKWFGDNGLIKIPIASAIKDIEEAWYFKFPNINNNKLKTNKDINNIKMLPENRYNKVTHFNIFIWLFVILFIFGSIIYYLF